MEKPRIVMYVPPTSWVPGKGHRPSFVTENQYGHSPNGGGSGNEYKEPWYWGDPNDAALSLDLAEKTAEEYNKKLGISEEEALEIIISSMRRR